MSKILEKPSHTEWKNSQKESSPDTLPVHPQIQTLYKKNLTAIAQNWNDRFHTETTHSFPDGKSYGKYDGKNLVVDYESEFWIYRGNELITQLDKSMELSGISVEKRNEIIWIINNHIRTQSDLTSFGKYIRIEAIILAYYQYHTKMRK